MFIFKYIFKGLSCTCALNPSHHHSKKFISSINTKKICDVTVISINRPNKINALNKETLIQLREAINNFEEDQNSSFSVLYGQGGNFSSGFDINDLITDLNELPSLFSEHFLKRPCRKPIIAAVNGYVVGQGLDLALWCDFRYMEENAVIGFLNRRFGVPVNPLTIQSLISMIGTSRTLQLISTGRPISSREAFDWGFCNKIVGSGTVIGESLDFAMKLAKPPQESLLVDRQVILSHKFTSQCLVKENYQLPNEKVTKHLLNLFIQNKFGRSGKFVQPEENELEFLKV